MHKVRYGLFFDNHTQMENPDVGKDFDPEYFTDQLKRCGVDYLGFHARCNVGMAYYDTKIGIRHPSLKYDLFGALAECCKKKDIALVAYLNGGLSTMEFVQHREWSRHPFPGDDHFGKVTPFALTVCYNSPFREHIVSMVREIAEKYPVQGFFIDCLGPYPCVCPTCVNMMKERGIDFTDRDAVTEFARQCVLSYSADIAKAAREIIPDPMLYFNGPEFTAARDLDTFFDCECLPTAGWGYEFLPVMAHASRNIRPGRQILNMTGRFYDWGDFGGLRTADSLKFDLFYGVAHGMRPNVGGHIHPRGDKDLAVFDRISEVYSDIRRYDPWYDGAVNLADTAIVCSSARRDVLTVEPAARSCVRMLDELKIQFDILGADGEKSWDGYKLLILPAELKITDLLAQKIREHIARGGAFLAFGKAAAETFGPELGIRCQGDSGLNPVYFRMHERFSKGLPDMFLSLYASSAIRAELAGAASDSRLVKPYYSPHWTGTHAIYYTPPQEETDMPFITVNGKCVWCAGDLCTGYSKRGALHLRDILRNIVDSLLDKPLVKDCEGLPACVRLILTEQPGRLNLNVIAYAPESRGGCPVVEDPVTVAEGSVKVLTAGRNITRVTLAPEGTPVEFTAEGDYTKIKLPFLKGYALLSLE